MATTMVAEYRRECEDRRAALVLRTGSATGSATGSGTGVPALEPGMGLGGALRAFAYTNVGTNVGTAVAGAAIIASARDLRGASSEAALRAVALAFTSWRACLTCLASSACFLEVHGWAKLQG